jgi:hypothetical protein
MAGIHIVNNITVSDITNPIDANAPGDVLIGGKPYKVYDANDPDFFKPRGHMFTFGTLNSNDYNFAGDGTAYPNSTNGYANGKQLLWSGKTVNGEHGVYLAPGNNKVMYLNAVKIFYNHTSKNLFAENYKDGVTDAASGVEFVHNGSSYCECHSPLCIAATSKEAPREVSDAIANGNYLYSQSLPLHCPGRFDGNSDDYFGLRTEGGNAIYLGTGIGSNKLTHMYFVFSGWLVSKVDIGGGDYQEVIAR